MLGRRIQAREPPVQNIRQLEATLHLDSNHVVLNAMSKVFVDVGLPTVDA
jgi:hypothetical protein